MRNQHVTPAPIARREGLAGGSQLAGTSCPPTSTMESSDPFECFSTDMEMFGPTNEPLNTITFLLSQSDCCIKL